MQMKNTTKILTLLLISVSVLSAKGLTTASNQPNIETETATRLISHDLGSIQGKLVSADASYFVIENEREQNIELIPREQVELLETNLHVNLFQLMREGAKNKLTDRIELNDGTVIPCIVLDMSNERIQYSEGTSLKRHVLDADLIYNVKLGQSNVDVSYPVVPAANMPTI